MQRVKQKYLSQQFSSVFTTENLSNIPILPPTVFLCINDITITDHGIECLLNDLSTNKASDPDELPPIVLNCVQKN